MDQFIESHSKSYAEFFIILADGNEQLRNMQLSVDNLNQIKLWTINALITIVESENLTNLELIEMKNVFFHWLKPNYLILQHAFFHNKLMILFNKLWVKLSTTRKLLSKAKWKRGYSEYIEFMFSQ